MKAKSYTFIHNKEKSMTNIPDEYFVDNTGLRIRHFDTENSYFNISVYGFLIKKDIFDKECKSFYTVNLVSKYTQGDVKGRRIAFVKFNTKLPEYDSESNAVKRLSSTEDWTVVNVIDNTSRWKHIPEDCYLLAVKFKSSGLKIRCFETEEDAIAEYDKKEEKRSINKKAKWDAIHNAPNNGNISLSTPKYIVERIHIKSNYIKDVKEGDIIYGDIPVLNNGENKLNKSSQYANYVDLYVNDKFYKTLPMNVFGDMFAKNMQLKIFV